MPENLAWPSEPVLHFIYYLVGSWGRSGLLTPIKSIGAAGSCAGFRRLLACEVLATFAGGVQGSGVAFRASFVVVKPHMLRSMSEIASVDIVAAVSQAVAARSTAGQIPGSRFARLVERVEAAENKKDLRSPLESVDLVEAGRTVARLLRAGGYTFSGGEINAGTGWGSWKNRTDKVLGTFFPLTEVPND